MPGGKNSSCGVKMCPSNVAGHRMSVHGIPEDRLIKRKWLKAMKKASFGPSVGVCERHFTDDSFVPKSKNIDFKGQPYLRNKLQHDAVPSLYLDHNSDDFKSYRATELAKENQIKKSSKSDDKNRAEELAKVPFKKSSKNNDKKFLIFKCKFCERSYSEGLMFQKHLSEVHNVSGPDAFDVHQKVSNQEFLDSIGIGPSVSNANKVENQIFSKEQNSISIPPTIIKVNVTNHEAVDEVVSKIIAGSEMNKHNLDVKQESIDVNPWNITSLHDLQYFICPSCDFQNSSKQTFVCHAFASHPEAVDFLKNISDGSLDNVLCPWNSQGGIMGNSKTMNTPNLTWSYETTSNFRTSKVEASDHDDDINQNDPLKANSENEDTFNEINYETVKMEVVDNLNDSAAVMKKTENEETSKLPHKCQYCGKSFANKSKLDLHVDIFHEYKCDPCNEFFFMESALKEHKLLVHEVLEGNKCPQCDQEFKQAKNLKRHFETVHEGQRNYNCNSCEKSFVSKQVLERHTHNIHEGHEKCPHWCERLNTNSRDHICDSCGNSYSAYSSLKKHIWEVHEDQKLPRDHKCENCGKAFTSKEKLSVHVLGIHQGIRPYICETPIESGQLCGKKFSTNFDLKRHIRRIHEEQPNNGPFECQQCIDPKTRKPRLFKDGRSLKDHIKNIHEKLRPHQCENCGKAFYTSSLMRHHIRITHEGERLICNFCGQTAQTNSDLKKHIRSIHEGIRENCESCDKTFSTKDQLRLHVRSIHEGIKMSCEKCGKSYVDKKTLQGHIKAVHEGLKEYVCKYCNKAFGHGGTLSKHVRAVHLKDPNVWKRKLKPNMTN